MGSAAHNARSLAVLGVTATLFFICLLPFELIPEIPVDIDQKPFFVPLALAALLPARRTGLAIGLGVALGEGIRDLMEGYELDDPIGFVGYIAGFWIASYIFALGPRNPLVLAAGAILCAFVQAAVEASSFLLFGEEAFVVAVQSAVGNTITHGLIWGAIPLIILVPQLYGKIEPALGYAPRGMPSPPKLGERHIAPAGDGIIARLDSASFRRPGAVNPSIRSGTMTLKLGDVVWLDGPPDASGDLAALLTGASPDATGGDVSGNVFYAERASAVLRPALTAVVQSTPLEQVAAGLMADGIDAASALDTAAATLTRYGIQRAFQRTDIWRLDEATQVLVLIAAAAARAPDLLIVDLPGDRGRELGVADALDGLIVAQRERGGATLILASGAASAFADDSTAWASLVDGTIEISASRPDPVSAQETALVAAGQASAAAAQQSEGFRIPTLHTGKATWWAARDPRVKWGLFFAVIALIYIVPAWEWMAVLFGFGVVLVFTARPPLGWLALAVAVQLPNVLGLILLPLVGDGASTTEELAFGFRLGFGWLAAILFGISLLSTMGVSGLVAGLRRLKFPRRFCFAVGYAFLLIYLSATDITRIITRLRADGLRFSLTRPGATIAGVARLFVPIIVAIAERGRAISIALTLTPPRDWAMPYVLGRLDGADRALVGVCGALIAAAVVLRLV